MSEDIKNIKEALLHICSAITDLASFVSKYEDRQNDINTTVSEYLDRQNEIDAAILGRIKEIEKRTGLWR